MTRPKEPAWAFNYAMAQARRLKLAYPKGLTGRDLGREFGLCSKSAVSVMNKHDFHCFDRRYRWEDVAAMLTYRQAVRMKQLHKIF